MSLYNMLFGTNPAADFLLAMLGIDRSFPGRFRDCYLDGDHIVVYTRTGGGNREVYEDANEAMHTVPGFVSDEDDDFDCTYAHFRYQVPEKFKAEIEILRDLGAGRDPRESWNNLFAKLNDPSKKDDPEVAAAMEKMKPVMEKLSAALSGEGPPVVTV